MWSDLLPPCTLKEGRPRRLRQSVDAHPGPYPRAAPDPSGRTPSRRTEVPTHRGGWSGPRASGEEDGAERTDRPRLCSVPTVCRPPERGMNVGRTSVGDQLVQRCSPVRRLPATWPGECLIMGYEQEGMREVLKLRRDIAVVAGVLSRTVTGESSTDFILWDQEVGRWKVLSPRQQRRALDRWEGSRA